MMIESINPELEIPIRNIYLERKFIQNFELYHAQNFDEIFGLIRFCFTVQKLWDRGQTHFPDSRGFSAATTVLIG